MHWMICVKPNYQVYTLMHILSTLSTVFLFMYLNNAQGRDTRTLRILSLEDSVVQIYLCSCWMCLYSGNSGKKSKAIFPSIRKWHDMEMYLITTVRSAALFIRENGQQQINVSICLKSQKGALKAPSGQRSLTHTGRYCIDWLKQQTVNEIAAADLHWQKKLGCFDPLAWDIRNISLQVNRFLSQCSSFSLSNSVVINQYRRTCEGQSFLNPVNHCVFFFLVNSLGL